jgi:hypothetical protein
VVDAALYRDDRVANALIPMSGHREYLFLVRKGEGKVEVVKIKIYADITQSANAHPDFARKDTDASENPFQTPGALGPEIVLGVLGLTTFLPIRAKVTERGTFFDLEGLILKERWWETLAEEEEAKSFQRIGKFGIKDQAECSKFLVSQRISQPNASGDFASSLLFKQRIIDIK